MHKLYILLLWWQALFIKETSPASSAYWSKSVHMFYWNTLLFPVKLNTDIKKIFVAQCDPQHILSVKSSHKFSLTCCVYIVIFRHIHYNKNWHYICDWIWQHPASTHREQQTRIWQFYIKIVFITSLCIMLKKWNLQQVLDLLATIV